MTRTFQVLGPVIVQEMFGTQGPASLPSETGTLNINPVVKSLTESGPPFHATMIRVTGILDVDVSRSLAGPGPSLVTPSPPRSRNAGLLWHGVEDGKKRKLYSNMANMLDAVVFLVDDH